MTKKKYTTPSVREYGDVAKLTQNPPHLAEAVNASASNMKSAIMKKIVKKREWLKQNRGGGYGRGGRYGD
jgi:hypothetical protein